MIFWNGIDPLNHTTTYTYDGGDNLLTLKDAKNQTYSFENDLLNRRTRFTYPDSSYEQWTYQDTATPGQVWTVYRGRDGTTMSCTYNNRGWETHCDYSDPNTPDVTKTYDAAGRILTVATATASHAYSYDTANQLLSETTTPAGLAIPYTVSYQYDADGNRTRLTYPSGLEVDLTYTARNQLKEVIADGPPPLASYTYNLNGNRIGKTLENGTATSYSYDMASRLTNVAHTQGASNLATVGYTLNAVGNRTAKNVAWASLPMHSEIYTYDPIDQLVTANYNGSNTVAYDYDPVGNRTSVSATASAPGVGTYTTNNLNQYTNAQGKVNLHDPRGNLTKVGVDLTFDYDSKNRLLATQNGTNTMVVTHDYQNRQVSRTINGTTVYFIYSGWSVIEERDATGDLVQKYVHGAQIDEILWKQNTTGEVYYHHDGLGSTVALTDVQGDLVESYSYDVFGSVTVYDSTFSILNFSFFQNRFLFTGREWIGEIGIYDYRNRIYSPELGRFLQTDPIRFDAGDVNLYRYVFNSSIDYFDAFGTDHKKKRQSTGKLTGSKKQKHDKSSPGARPKGGARGGRTKPNFTPVGLALIVFDDFFERECPKGQYWRIIKIDDCGVPIYGCTGNLSA